MKKKVVRYVKDRTGTVDGGYDYTILAVKRACLRMLIIRFRGLL